MRAAVMLAALSIAICVTGAAAAQAGEPTVRGRNAVGAQMWQPSGAGASSTPTIDPTRNTVYHATGDSSVDGQ